MKKRDQIPEIFMIKNWWKRQGEHCKIDGCLTTMRLIQNNIDCNWKDIFKKE